MTHESVLLRTKTGLELAVRPLRAGDRELLVRGFDELSNEGRYKRFFTPMPELSGPMLDRLVGMDQQSHIALGAVDPTRDISTGGHGVGVVRAIRSNHDPARAELAITVVNDYQHQGVGAMLIAALAAAALSRGILTFDADILATNRPMKALIRHLGGTIEPVPDDRTIVRAHLQCATAASRLRSDAREHLSRLFDLASADLQA